MHHQVVGTPSTDPPPISGHEEENISLKANDHATKFQVLDRDIQFKSPEALCDALNSQWNLLKENEVGGTELLIQIEEDLPLSRRPKPKKKDAPKYSKGPSIYCKFPGCQVKGEKGFFKFPTNDEARLVQWLQICGIKREELGNGWKICIEHFKQSGGLHSGRDICHKQSPA